MVQVRSLHFCWGQTILTYSIPNSGLPVPVKIKTDVCFSILIKELPVCIIGQDEIVCSQFIDMDQHSIKNVMNPIDYISGVNAQVLLLFCHS